MKNLALAMTAFIGTKSLMAVPMTRQEYLDYRGWELPKNEDPTDAGYLVEYMDGGKPNDERHAGYISWSPKDVFESAYHASGSFNFGDVVTLLKAGYKVARNGWNGKGMYLLLIKGDAVEQAIAECYGNGSTVELPVLDAIYMKTADNKLVPWLASQTDMLAEDWQVL